MLKYACEVKAFALLKYWEKFPCECLFVHQSLESVTWTTEVFIQMCSFFGTPHLCTTEAGPPTLIVAAYSRNLCGNFGG